MKISAHLIVVVLLSALLFSSSCNSATVRKEPILCPPETRLKQEQNPWGFEEKCLNKKGRMQGPHYIWYEKGKLKLICYYKNGLPHGTFEQWFEDGTKSVKGQFTNGQEVGNFIFWDQNGKVKIIREFHVVNKRQMLTLWWPDGSKKEEGPVIRHLIKNGKWTFYHKNGRKESEGEFVEHKKQGLWIQWDESGNEVGREFYKDDKIVSQ